jgi:hypothetical protein
MTEKPIPAEPNPITMHINHIIHNGKVLERIRKYGTSKIANMDTVLTTIFLFPVLGKLFSSK